MPEDKYGHFQYYEIFQTYHKEHNQDESTCYERGSNNTVTDCIERYIDSELGCHIPWHTNDGREGHADCWSEKQFHNYVLLSYKLSSLDSKDMRHETQCMHYCDRMEYKLWETTPLGMKAKYPPEWMTLSFIFSSGKRRKALETFFITCAEENLQKFDVTKHFIFRKL